MPGPEQGQDQVKKFAHDADTPPIRYYLTRAGAVLGPYTEFQILESLRLGIFESHDLAWAEGGQEWLEISRRLPAASVPPASSQAVPQVLAQASEPRGEGQEVSPRQPGVDVPRQPNPRRFTPLTEQQLREHETLFALSAPAAFIAELTRGRFAEGLSETRARIMDGLRHRYKSMLRKCFAPRAYAAYDADPNPREALLLTSDYSR